MTDAQDPAELSKLLPFYLNGTLPPEQRARIERGLAASPALRAELDEHRRLLSLVKTGAAPWAEPGDRPAPIVAANDAAGASHGHGSFLAYLSPANWNPAVSLALALAVGAQAAALLWQGRTIGALRHENYELASGKDPIAGKGSILVEIKDGAAWSEVAQLFTTEGVTIVAGADFGALVLHSDKQGTALSQQIERLRASPLIASADPAE